MQEKFRMWLVEVQFFVEPAANSYSVAIIRISEHYSRHKKPVNIYKIDDVQTLEPIRVSYQKGGEFSDWGRRIGGLGVEKIQNSGGLWRAAINKYSDFLQHMDSNPESLNQAPLAQGKIAVAPEANNNFSYENDLQTALCNQLRQLFPDYTLLGREYKIGNKRIDVLLEKSSDESLLVIELKAGTARKEVLAQIGEYMGLLREEYKEQTIKGVVIAGEIGGDLRLAVRGAGTDKISLQTYEMKLELSEVDMQHQE